MKTSGIAGRLQATLLKDIGDVGCCHVQFRRTIAAPVEFLRCDVGQLLAKVVGLNRIHSARGGGLRGVGMYETEGEER